MHDLDAINAFNKMHASCKVRVEWGIGGTKVQVDEINENI
jgi:hypothetical protein